MIKIHQNSCGVYYSNPIAKTINNNKNTSKYFKTVDKIKRKWWNVFV